MQLNAARNPTAGPSSRGSPRIACDLRGSEQSWEVRGGFPLVSSSLRPAALSDPQNCFELYIPDNKDQVIKACKTEADGRVVEGNHTVYRISAPTPEEKEEWIKCIK